MRKMNKIGLLGLSALVVISLTSVLNVLGTNLFCGYDFPYSSYPGVSGYIKTVDHDTPSGEIGCEWVMIVLSYGNGYYIQIGYTEEDAADPYPRAWFIAHRDADTGGNEVLNIVRGVYPSTGGSWFYQIDSPSGGWNLICKSGTETIWSTVKSTNPTSPVGLQAMCESTTSDVVIDGSEFRYLSYYTTAGGGDWNLWNDHYYAEHSPYTLTQTNDYTFDADGGGP